MGVRLAAVYRRASTALVVLAAGVALSAMAAYLVAGQTEREERLKFQSAVGDARDAIGTRIHDYADVLRGVRGLFAAVDTVKRDEFRRYMQNLDLADRYPGIQVIHFSRRIREEERPAFEAMVRGDTSVDPRGYPGFRIRPAGDRPEYVVALYVEPMEGNERALGLDLGGDPVRLAALERTRDSGGITASGTIALALDPTRHPGFAMRLALYRQGAPIATVAQRREAFAGVVSASFVVIDLMRGVLREPFHRDIRVQIHDAGFLDNPKGLASPDAENLLFDSNRLRDGTAAPWVPAAAGERALPITATDLDVGGRRWNLYFSARQPLSTPFERLLPWVVLAVGMTISLLLSGLIRSLATTGNRAVELADRMTGDLRRSEARLAEAQRMTEQLIEALPNPIFFKGTDGRYLGVNKAWEAYFATPRTAFIGRSVNDLYPDNPEIVGHLHARDQELWDRPGAQTYETAIRTPDGQDHDAIYYKATFTRTDGSVAGLIGTVIDITERKRSERALRESESRYRSVVAAIAEGVLLRDKDRRIVTCNASAERILGRTLEQMRDNTYFDPSWQAIREDGSAFPDEERPVNAAQRTGKPQYAAAMGFRKPDGSVLWLSMSAQPLFDESDGTLSGIVTTIADITQRIQVEQRQSMEHRVTRLLAEAETAAEVMPKIIQTLCETFGFACGARTLVDERAQAVACAETWSVPRAEVMEFVAAERQPLRPQSAAGGLLRRVWASGEPVWIADVREDASFRRAPLAAKAGLRGAFAFPIRFGNEILGIMEFFSRDSRQPDEALMQSTRSIGSQIGQFMARKQAEERMLHLAHFDGLTGLPNRSMFNQRLDHALAQARRGARSVAILFLDLDRFKNINDTLGHEAGDRVLKEAAERLGGCLRESDTVARLGGDEFVVLIEELTQPEQVAAVAQKILVAIAKSFNLDAREFHITASIGISTFPADSEDTQGLLKNADVAMYRAKEQGKNNYQFYSAQMNVHTLERLAIESDLRRALERDEFLLHYQPKVDIGSGRITGMEALVRWRQPGKALIPPAQFIPLAEETGLIVPIGQWVLQTACLRNKAWQDQGLPRMRIAVNLSARQFAQENLLEDVARTLTETGLDPALLEFEITESMAMRDAEHTVKLLGGLKAMGIHLSIDDFGTGYSSLNYLKRFPLDSLKIDRSFIQDIPGDADDAAITRAIIAMAHSLRLGVIAEGVETEEQLGFLREHGCDEMQGNCFSKPLPEDEFLLLLQREASGKSISPD